MEQMRKLPIGIQTFEKLREENYLYVDKTAMVYKIASNSTPYFLSRPRRPHPPGCRSAAQRSPPPAAVQRR